ncbi:MAG: tripartite tricarboxylate transporter substrate binding protein [Betaproteobacteria bacterium]|nr:tripartite tricarboxylate transporter substrate binding protein [Betaproteobacteria bacterium]
MRTLLRCLAAAAFAVFAVPMAAAQPAWPAKPVRVVVPYAPGGITDSVARILTARMQGILGQPLLIENRVGAGGAIGTEYVAKAAPDGYTLLMGSAAPQTLLQFIQKVGYDGLKDFSPITTANTNPLVLMVNPSLPVKNVRELIALAKSRPGKLNFGGGGGLTQFSGEIFKFMAGIDMVYVAYKGGAPATAAAAAGDVEVTFANYSDALAHLKAGRLRALGVTGSRRFPQSPEVPTIAESGLPGYAVDSWNGLFAPAGTPGDIVQRVAGIARQAMADPATRKRMDDIGAEPGGDTPEQFRAFVQSELQKWGNFVKQTGIKIQQ